MGGITEELFPELYLIANPDVKAAGVDPVAHYLEFGMSEGRKLRPEGFGINIKEKMKKVARGLRSGLRPKNRDSRIT